MNIYSYSQLSQYLACPKKYRYRYIDGWQERDTRAATIFGRVFEHALGTLFRHEDPAAAFYDEWNLYRSVELDYSRRLDCILAIEQQKLDSVSLSKVEQHG